VCRSDAALVSSSNLTAATFLLRELAEPMDADRQSEALPDASGVPDGGAAGEVPLSTNCHSGRDAGAVCVAKPTEPLKPLTTYEWSVAMVEPAVLVPGYLQPSPWQRFTTGEEPSSAALPESEARVTRHEIITDAMCASGAIVTLEFSSGDSDAPVVINVTDVTPEYVTEAVVLSEETPLVEMTLYSAPACFTLETFDRTGVRRELRDLCPEAELPATTPTRMDGARNGFTRRSSPAQVASALSLCSPATNEPAQVLVERGAALSATSKLWTRALSGASCGGASCGGASCSPRIDSRVAGSRRAAPSDRCSLTLGSAARPSFARERDPDSARAPRYLRCRRCPALAAREPS
jgi:hypothetical protein